MTEKTGVISGLDLSEKAEHTKECLHMFKATTMNFSVKVQI